MSIPFYGWVKAGAKKLSISESSTASKTLARGEEHEALHIIVPRFLDI